MDINLKLLMVRGLSLKENTQQGNWQDEEMIRNHLMIWNQLKEDTYRL